LLGLLLLLGPIAAFTLSLPFLTWLKPGLRKLYRITGGVMVFCGSGTALYFAMYGGDQGGIAAYFVQVAVIAVYAALCLFVALANWLLLRKDASGRGR